MVVPIEGSQQTALFLVCSSLWDSREREQGNEHEKRASVSLEQECLTKQTENSS